MTNYKYLPLSDSGELIKHNVAIKSPRNLVIVKYPKSGSTLSLCNVPKIFVGDTEGGTSSFEAHNNVVLQDGTEDYVETSGYGLIPKRIHDIVDEMYHANKMADYWLLYNNMQTERDPKEKDNLYKRLVEHINNMPLPIFAIDTITSLVQISNRTALAEYNSGIKNVANRKSDIKRVDEYGGTRYIRAKFRNLKEFFERNAAPFIQYHGHISMRKKVLNKSEEDISAIDIALEGMQSVIFTAEADNVCIMYRNEKGVFLDFRKRDTETDMGARSLHLSNLLLKIADIVPDEELRKGTLPKTYWKEVYPELEF